MSVERASGSIVYDAAVVLGCRTQLIGDPGDGSAYYMPSSFYQADQNGMLGGEFRVIGATALYFGSMLSQDLPTIRDDRYIFTGGSIPPINNPTIDDAPTEADVYAGYFMEIVHSVSRQPRLLETGITARPPEIICESGSLDTVQGLANILAIARENKLGRLLVLTNQYHVLRARAMAAMVLAKQSGNDLPTLAVHAAESFGSFWGPEFVADHLAAYYSNNPWQRRIADRRRCSEAHGLYAIAKDMYGNAAWRKTYDTMSLEERMAIQDQWSVNTII